MKIYLTNQVGLFPKHLHQLCALPVMNYAKHQLKEKITVIEVDTTRKLEEIDLSFLFEYMIFPPHVMSYLAQWNYEGRSMKVGDTIVQQVYIPPLPCLSQKIVFGVRISEIVNESNRKGFSYETLIGHVEKGISTFRVETLDNGKIIFAIKTFSAPATLLTRVLGPIFSVPYQVYCTNQALKNVKKIIEGQLKEESVNI